MASNPALGASKYRTLLYPSNFTQLFRLSRKLVLNSDLVLTLVRPHALHSQLLVLSGLLDPD